MDEGTGEGDALTLTAGELARVVVGFVVDAEVGELRFGGGVGEFLVFAVLEVEGEGDVFEYGHVCPEVKLLEDHADFEPIGPKGAFGFRSFGDGFAIEDDAALVDRFEEGEAAQEGGFAAAGFASDHHALAFGEGEGDVGEDVGVVEFFAEVFDDEEFLGHGDGLNAFGAAEFFDALEAAEGEVEGDDRD